jgi:hypothetical protein
MHASSFNFYQKLVQTAERLYMLSWKSQQYNMETILCGMLEELEFPNRLYIKLIRIYMTKTVNVRLRLPFLEKRPKMPVKVVRNI